MHTFSIFVIILNWNGWDDTIACLESLSRLDCKNVKVVVVDNGSTDGSVSRIHTAYPKTSIIETGKNLGFSGGCNEGAREALREGARYIWLLNNDTVVDPHALSAMVTMAESNQQIGAVGSVLYYLDDPKKIQAWGGGVVSFWLGRARHLNAEPKTERDVQYLTAASVLLRCDAIRDIGLLDAGKYFMYWEDVDLSFRLRKSGWRLAVSEKSVVYHREHASTGEGNPLLDYYFNESAVRFFRQHAPVPLIPVATGFFGRLSKRILSWDRARVVATLKGTYNGLRYLSR